ncbi:unnamed protein product [Porites lobata]|uniref:SHQ1-like CS domain-containing protein n=1 Tax=Porites lobata TaxID=104759 RepID=A0ABN8PU87_9CNID|nr:unnamed protein product [Porites lobata]
MLTPVFELSQDDDFVVVIIKTAYVKIADVDFCINGTEFKFYVKPYFLGELETNHSFTFILL